MTVVWWLAGSCGNSGDDDGSGDCYIIVLILIYTNKTDYINNQIKHYDQDTRIIFQTLLATTLTYKKGSKVTFHLDK